MYKYFSSNSFEKRGLWSSRICSVSLAGFIIEVETFFIICAHTSYGCFVINMEHYHAMFNGASRRVLRFEKKGEGSGKICGTKCKLCTF